MGDFLTIEAAAEHLEMPVPELFAKLKRGRIDTFVNPRCSPWVLFIPWNLEDPIEWQEPFADHPGGAMADFIGVAPDLVRKLWVHETIEIPAMVIACEPEDSPLPFDAWVAAYLALVNEGKASLPFFPDDLTREWLLERYGTLMDLGTFEIHLGELLVAKSDLWLLSEKDESQSVASPDAPTQEFRFNEPSTRDDAFVAIREVAMRLYARDKRPPDFKAVWRALRNNPDTDLQITPTTTRDGEQAVSIEGKVLSRDAARQRWNRYTRRSKRSLSVH